MARNVNPDTQKLAMSALIESGIAAIAKDGIDQISVQSISDGAKNSRPTFYSYFGDINGLLAEIWLAKADYWLELVSNPETSPAAMNLQDKALNRTITEILAASHRIPEVEELVQPKITSWWAKYKNEPTIVQLKVIWLLAERIGVTITDPVDPMVHQAEFIEAALKMIPDTYPELPKAIRKEELPAVSEPSVSGESLDTRLMQSAIAVIASSGVKSASMARVARKAQVSTGAVYPRFSKVDSLVESAFGEAVNEVIKQNFGLLVGTNFTAEDFGSFVLAGLLPDRQIWRNFRVEIHLGARTRPALAARMAENLKETNAQVSTKLTAFPIPYLTKGPIPYLVHAVGIGLAILQNAGLPVGSIDHRQISKAMTEVINAANPAK
jgi:AcrR family transcriptional regulator